ncbi:MAG TPA: hypothetical protein VG759_03105 [Candidatus Angelobacter sp.]|jgi:hypothetical protein|nr:hypothetical protein [Candidatus Angelobacter sp.]
MTLDVRPEIAEQLKTIAAAQGLSVEAFLQQLIDRELSAQAEQDISPEGNGMVWENGVLVYRTGNPLPAHIVDNAIRRSREERSRHVLGDLP